MADKRISQLIERVDIANNDVLPIVASGATTTNKVTVSTLQDWMQENLDVGVTSVGITIGSTGTDVNVTGSPVTSSGNITINIPTASATARGVVSTGSQTFAGAKTFNSDLIVNGITVGKGIGASNGNNTAIGLNCLSSNTTGTLNTATGLSALQYNTAGNSNTANGANSLVANTTGGFNTAIGNQSLYSNSTGQANTAIGLNSLYSNTTGTYNIGVGSGAGYYIADGSTPNTTSDFSIYLGADTKASVDGAQNEVVIGYNAIGNGSNTVTIGNSSVTDNYFTGTIRSTALRLAESGTANATLFRNTSSDSSSLTNHNVIGFNNSNDIFVTTQNDGGFILSFNNSTSNKVYILQDASGTLAFTSDIPSLAGYVTLGTVQSITAQKTFTTSGGDDTLIINHTSGSGIALDISKGGNGEGLRVIKTSGSGNAVTISGGLLSAEAATLTGALNGTSASFTGAVGAASLSGAFATLSNYGSATSTALQLGDANNGLFRPALNSVAIATNGASALTLSSTGAATFSSSVTARNGVFKNPGSDPNNTLFVQTSDYVFASAGSLLRLGHVATTGNTTAIIQNLTLGGTGTGNISFPDGNVGIGTPTPGNFSGVSFAGPFLDVTGVMQIKGTAANGVAILQFGGETYRKATIETSIQANDPYLAFGVSSSGSSSSGTERMRITSGGFLKAKGNESTYYGSTIGYHELRTAQGDEWIAICSNTSASPYGLRIIYPSSAPNNTDNYPIYFNDVNAFRFGVQSNGNVVNQNGSYGAISDIKLKENIEDATPKLDDLMKVKVRNYNLIGDDKKQIGVIAQELEEVFPAMIDESEDFEEVEVPKLDEEGNEILNEEGEVVTEKQRVSKGTSTKSVKYSVFVPMLIKAMQEQQEQIKVLTEQIDSLKNQMQ